MNPRPRFPVGQPISIPQIDVITLIPNSPIVSEEDDSALTFDFVEDVLSGELLNGGWKDARPG